jgi:hypothetical protein
VSGAAVANDEFTTFWNDVLVDKFERAKRAQRRSGAGRKSKMRCVPSYRTI